MNVNVESRGKKDTLPSMTKMAAFFVEKNVKGIPYLDMLRNFLMPQLDEEEGQEFIFIFHQDGAPPHWHEKSGGTCWIL